MPAILLGPTEPWHFKIDADPRLPDSRATNAPFMFVSRVLKDR